MNEYFIEPPMDHSEAIKELGKIMDRINHNFYNADLRFYKMPRLIFRGITRESQSYRIIGDDRYVRCGLSVRLRQNEKGHSTATVNRAEYINYLLRLIQEARKSYPAKYSSLTDLEVLADIQHNGGATCLVDFSKNMLISLWFACSDSLDHDGYLLCYNVTEDLVVNNSLTTIKPQDMKRPINELISETSRFVDPCSSVTSRFCMWDPSAVNSRITRQDSVFIFGIEHFKISAMTPQTMLSIRISKKSKVLLRRLIENMFNITESTIYSDSVGFAISNSKFKPLYNNLPYDTDQRLYQMGLEALLIGNYKEAIEIMNGISSNNDFMEIETSYSRGVCYKNLEVPTDYTESAIMAYHDVISRIDTLISRDFVSKDDNASIVETEKLYYIKKAVRAYNEIIDLCYRGKKYERGVKYCCEIERFFDKLKAYADGLSEKGNRDANSAEIIVDYVKSLKTDACKLYKFEFCILDRLSNPNSEGNEAEVARAEVEAINTRYHGQDAPSRITFEDLLIQFYLLLDRVIDRSTVDITAFRKLCDCKFDIEPEAKESENYYHWDFVDLKMAIDALDGNSVRKEHLQEILAMAIDARDRYEGQYNKTTDDI